MQVSFKIKSNSTLMSERGLGTRGRVQKFIDKECLKRMDPYTPRITGGLIKSAVLGTVIGSGKIVYASPAARYLYYGKLMVSKETGSAYAKHGESKVLTDKDLEYNKGVNPKAGKLWFERMKADHKKDILAGARKIAGGNR